MVDLVIWNEERGGYRQVLHDQIMGLVAAGVEANVIDRPGGIFVRAADQISAEDRTLLQSVARAIFTDSRGTLADQVRRRVPIEPAIPRLAVSEARVPPSASQAHSGTAATLSWTTDWAASARTAASTSSSRAKARLRRRRG